MLDLLKVTIVFLFILFLLRKKINVGYAMLAGSLMFIVFYPQTFNKIPNTFVKSLTSHTFLNLLLSLTLIKSFEFSLRQVGLMQKMTEASQNLLNSKKFSIISMPMIIGMLPSLGGAYLSAPMVDSATKDTKMSNEEKAFVNYWYRHPWELILPLYPGIVLASVVSGVPLGELMLIHLPIVIIFFITGFLFSMKGVKNFERKIVKQRLFKSLYSFIPIVLVLLSVIIFKIDLYIALFANIILLSLWFKKGFKKLYEIIKYGFTWDVIILVIGVIIFKEILQISGAVQGLAEVITQSKIPYLFVFVMLPLLTGLITGLSVGFVGSTFPILMHIKNIVPYEISIAFVSGYAGVLLSPLHLCLILTKEYFKADILGIYKKIIPATLIILFSALIEFAILRYYS